MRSAADDLTARARIRDAAIGLFGRDGLDRTTVRAIAQAASVSPALVLHHFGSKEGLRRACDEHLLELIREGKAEAMTGEAPPSLEAYLATLGDAAAAMRYLARVLQEGGEAARRIYTGLVDDAESYLADAVANGVVQPTSDPRARATLLVSWGLAHLLLGPLAAEVLGADDEMSATARVTRPALEVYTHGLFADSRFLDALGGEAQETQE